MSVKYITGLWYSQLLAVLRSFLTTSLGLWRHKIITRMSFHNQHFPQRRICHVTFCHVAKSLSPWETSVWLRFLHSPVLVKKSWVPIQVNYRISFKLFSALACAKFKFGAKVLLPRGILEDPMCMTHLLICWKKNTVWSCCLTGMNWEIVIIFW